MFLNWCKSIINDWEMEKKVVRDEKKHSSSIYIK